MPYQLFDRGQVVTNDELRETFRVGNMGGMRKSNTYRCMVLISDHAKGLYEDEVARWLSKERLYNVDWLSADIFILPAVEKHWPQYAK